MGGIIYLIGGGEILRGETAEIDADIRKNTEENASFVFFGTAASDSAEYGNTIRSVFGNRFTVTVVTEEKGRDFALDAIDSARVIYLGGGDAELLLNLFEKWGLVDSLHRALARGVNIVGMSAGAQALSAWYVHEKGKFIELRRGWGIAPSCTLVHAQPDTRMRARNIWRGSADAHVYTLIAIGERAAWRIAPDHENAIGGGNVWREEP